MRKNPFAVMLAGAAAAIAIAGTAAPHPQGRQVANREPGWAFGPAS
ncbi:MAG TPA: hypothetical protein VGG35_06405 [Streptosporangiaceae bacterium]|jgi:hypothetical protein